MQFSLIFLYIIDFENPLYNSKKEELIDLL